MICYDVSLAPRTTSLALFAASSIVVKFLAVYAFPLGGIYYTAMLLGSLRQKCEMSSLMWFKKNCHEKNSIYSSLSGGWHSKSYPQRSPSCCLTIFHIFLWFLSILSLQWKGLNKSSRAQPSREFVTCIVHPPCALTQWNILWAPGHVKRRISGKWKNWPWCRMNSCKLSIASSSGRLDSAWMGCSSRWPDFMGFLGDSWGIVRPLKQVETCWIKISPGPLKVLFNLGFFRLSCGTSHQFLIQDA